MGRAMVEPLYVLPAGVAGERRLIFDMLPGRFVFGVRPRRGFSVGGRGAGPGFMNWLFEYILLEANALTLKPTHMVGERMNSELSARDIVSRNGGVVKASPQRGCGESPAPFENTLRLAAS